MRGAAAGGVAVVFLAGLLLAGCTTGRNFAKPAPETLALGKTGRAEIVNAYGPPFRQSAATISDSGTPPAARSAFDMVPVSGNYNGLVYLYQERTVGLVSNTATTKLIGFDFWNDKLIGYNFISNFTDDSTNFDETKVSSLVKNATTKDGVVQLMGAPTGRTIYPEVQNQGDEKFVYDYVAVNDQTHERLIKRLEILFTADNRIRDYRFVSGVGPAPAQPSGGSTFVPVVIPMKR